MPLSEDVQAHLLGLADSFSGVPQPLVVEDVPNPFRVPAFEAADDRGRPYKVHPWQFVGLHVGSFLGIEPKPGAPEIEVSFNGVTIELPDGRWMTFIDSGDVMAQLGVMPSRAVLPVPPPTPVS